MMMSLRLKVRKAQLAGLPPDDFQRLIKMLSEAEPARPEITEEEFQMRLMS